MDDRILGAFQVLGLEPNATHEEVQEAYRDLVKVWHPDRFENDPRLAKKGEEMLKQVNVAFERLEAFFNSSENLASELQSVATSVATGTNLESARLKLGWIISGAFAIFIGVLAFSSFFPTSQNSGDRLHGIEILRGSEGSVAPSEPKLGKRGITREEVIRQVRAQGENPQDYDIDAAVADLNAPSPTQNDLSDKVRYWIIVKDGTSSGEYHYSEKEPKVVGAGFKFMDMILKREIIVSGNVQIIKVK